MDNIILMASILFFGFSRIHMKKLSDVIVKNMKVNSKPFLTLFLHFLLIFLTTATLVAGTMVSIMFLLAIYSKGIKAGYSLALCMVFIGIFAVVFLLYLISYIKIILNKKNFVTYLHENTHSKKSRSLFITFAILRRFFRAGLMGILMIILLLIVTCSHTLDTYENEIPVFTFIMESFFIIFLLYLATTIFNRRTMEYIMSHIKSLTPKNIILYIIIFFLLNAYVIRPIEIFLHILSPFPM